MATIKEKRMKSIKEKADEYAKMKHTNMNLIDIVSWDFEAGANYVLEVIEDSLAEFNNTEDYSILQRKIKELKGK